MEKGYRLQPIWLSLLFFLFSILRLFTLSLSLILLFLNQTLRPIFPFYFLSFSLSLACPDPHTRHHLLHPFKIFTAPCFSFSLRYRSQFFHLLFFLIFQSLQLVLLLLFLWQKFWLFLLFKFTSWLCFADLWWVFD